MRISDRSSDVCSSDLILQALLERMELARQLDRALELRPGIVALEPRMLAVEQRGGQHVIAVGGIVVRQLADMVGDPEDFLDQDEPAAAFADRKSTRLNSSH